MFSSGVDPLRGAGILPGSFVFYVNDGFALAGLGYGVCEGEASGKNANCDADS
jgi:hypothetical protein